MQRWAISLDSEARNRLKPELLQLGSPVVGPNGEQLLMFRDRFVGLRVASAARTSLRPLKGRSAA